MMIGLDAISFEQNRIVRFHVVTDLCGIGVAHARPRVVSVLRRVSEIFKENYPEVQERIIVVNAPWGFASMFKLVRPFIPARTQAKIEVHRGVEVLRDLLPRGKLPKVLGGRASNADLVMPGALLRASTRGASRL